ncbi:hypothetical protein LJB96_02930 [Methanobrevibacter sp. OttesenSCG-928-K11]|nr:hypothetical protein [Methanobrevibacter sp. OttesenSCG-928-K11]
MKKRFIIIIIIAILVIGGLFLFNITKTESFDGRYTLDVPIVSNFERNNSTGNAIIFSDLNNQIFTSYIEKNSTENILTIEIIKKALETQNEVKVDNNSNYAKFYKVNIETFLDLTGYSNLKFFIKHIYIASYDHKGIYILIGTIDLDKLSKITESINITKKYNSTNDLVNTTEIKDSIKNVTDGINAELKTIDINYLKEKAFSYI